MKSKNYKIVSLYSFFPFQENLILDLKNKLLEIENENKNDLSGLLILQVRVLMELFALKKR